MIVVALSLAGCAAESVWAPDEAVARARYTHAGSPEITLYTVISNRSGEGAHSALLINGSERVLFDPAGTWYNPLSPERNDVHFGITPRLEERYIDYHSRVTYHIVIQRREVAPEVAERALQLAKAAGPVPQAFCTSATSGILTELPGFETLPRTMFPKTLMTAFESLPGVRSEAIYDDDPHENKERLAVEAAALRESLEEGD